MLAGMVRKLAAALLVALILVPFTAPFPTLTPASAATRDSKSTIDAVAHQGLRSHDCCSLVQQLRLFTRALGDDLRLDRVGAAAVVRLIAVHPLHDSGRRPSPLRI
jgi:hypothetical protein